VRGPSVAEVNNAGRPKEVHVMEHIQDIVQDQEQEQENQPLDIEFVGTLEDVTAGWTGPTDDGWDGDWTP
jgi:hypothetical protein